MLWSLSKDCKRRSVPLSLFRWALCRLLSRFLLSDNSPLWTCFQQERHQQLDSVQVPWTIWNALRHPAWLPASNPEWQRSYAARCSVKFASPVGIHQISQGTWNDSRFLYAGNWIDLQCLQLPMQHSFPVSGNNSIINNTVKKDVFQNRANISKFLACLNVHSYKCYFKRVSFL